MDKVYVIIGEDHGIQGIYYSYEAAEKHVDEDAGEHIHEYRVRHD